MILDSIITISCILAFYTGWKKGIVSAILSLVGVMLGTIISLRLSHMVASFLEKQHIVNTQYMLPISFILLFIGVVLIVRFIIKLIEGVLKMAMLGWANKLTGAALYVFIALFFASALFWLSNTVGIITNTAKQESKAYAVVEPIAPKAIETISNYIPFCNNVLQQIKSLANKIPIVNE
jgi:membrane protein required for colicin V production